MKSFFEKLIWLFKWKPNPLPKWFIIIFAPPGNGKSLEQARLSYQILREYQYIEHQYPNLKHRYLFTNQILNKSYICKKLKLTSEWYDAHVLFWEQPNQLRYCPIKNCWKGVGLHKLHDCDLSCDEGATLFPATSKGNTDDMPLWMKKLIAQHRHNGIRIILLTQDFMGINISARRCVWDAYYMHKIIGSRDISATLPPPKFIWGWYTKQKISPDLIKADSNSVIIDIQMAGEEKKKALKDLKLIGHKSIFWIGKHKCSLYDTTQDVKEMEIKREIEHIEVKCLHPACGYIHKVHKLK